MPSHTAFLRTDPYAVPVVVQILAIKISLGLSSYVFDLDQASWDDALVNGLDLVANHVLQIPLFLMTLMRYLTPTLDDLYVTKPR